MEIEEIQKLIDYDPVTGLIKSKISRPGVKAGSVMGTVRKTNGYLQIGINRKLYYAHRLAMMISGYDIEGAQVDHIDGDKLNNRLANLRVSRNFENSQNIKGPYKTNTTGILGVKKANQKSGYVARISVKGKVIHLGTYDSADAAGAAYLKAKRKYHEFNTL